MYFRGKDAYGRIEKMFTFYQGEFIEEEKIKISIRSKIFNYGLGCFEGIRAYWNEIEEQLYVLKLEEHYKRLLNSCKVFNLNIPYTCEELGGVTVELLKKNNARGNNYIRPVVYKGSESPFPTLSDQDNRVVIYCQDVSGLKQKEAYRVGISNWKKMDDNMIPIRVKPCGGYINSALAAFEAESNGFDDALLLTYEGNVAEGTSENIFILKNDTLVTPPLSDNILEGITRKIVFDIAAAYLNMDVVERSITRNELFDADEIFYTGTAIEIMPVIEIDHRMIGTGAVGAVSEKIRKVYHQIVRGEDKKYRNSITTVY